jgi:glutamyl-tRNA synthetase
MASTPMHVALYNAFNWTPPQFGHVPLLVDKNGQKLSKRNADIDISSFRDKDGILPATLINFAALLGWSHTQRSDVFSLKELESIVRNTFGVSKVCIRTILTHRQFNLKITKGNTIVAFDKLWFLQKAHAQRFALEGGSEFEDLVDKISEAAAVRWTNEQL